MTKSSKKIDVYLEIGRKRTLVSAMEWPGWCRVGRDEEDAFQTLFETGPRYASVIGSARLGFQVPQDPSMFHVVQRLKGNATTDYGVPALAPTKDGSPINDKELKRLQTILKACWRALDDAARVAKGKTLRLGPRGGGRTLKGILEHVYGAELGYLSSLGGKMESTSSPDDVHQAILKTLIASAHGEVAKKGPRGGKRWSPRYFARREAWHVLDHVWEIEDRMKSKP